MMPAFQLGQTGRFQAQAAGVAANLLSWYSMEDNAASAVILDALANKPMRINTAHNTSTQTVAGLVGNAQRVHNNSTTKMCHILNTSNDTAFDFEGAVSWTAGGWFKSTAGTNPDFTQRYFGRISGLTAYGGWGVLRLSGTTDLVASMVNGGSTVGSTTAISITPTNWTFLVFRYDHVANQLSLIVDTTVQSTTPSSTFTNGTNPADFSIGRHIVRATGVMNTTGTTADFDVDQFFVANAAYPDSTLTVLYNGGAGLTYAAAIATGLL